MTYFVAKFNSFFTKKDTNNTAFSFFFETKLREKKRIYAKALMKAQLEQESVLKAAKVKKLVENAWEKPRLV